MIGGNGLHSAEMQSTSRTQHFVFLALQEEMLASFSHAGTGRWVHQHKCSIYKEVTWAENIASPSVHFSTGSYLSQDWGVPTMSDPSTEATASISAPQTNGASPSKPTILLIHGLWMTSSCWEDVRTIDFLNFFVPLLSWETMPAVFSALFAFKTYLNMNILTPVSSSG